ncbi:hypothetical protein [Agaribacterium sp. ZY112]|uniref:hypothetical protein n=1 Tax=Agaribacterium sp. ZY112 TaxID=3233574 RepID=UPI003524F061
MSQFDFFDDSPTSPSDSKIEGPIKVLVIDDDESVHDVTRLVLRRKTVNGRKIELHSCLSAREAKELLSTKHDFCLAIIDVIMETEDAGLRLIDWIREQPTLNTMTLVVRTGQPGVNVEEPKVDHLDLLEYCYKTSVNASTLKGWVDEAAKRFEQVHNTPSST